MSVTSSRNSCRSSGVTSRTSAQPASSSPPRRTRPLLRSGFAALAGALLVSGCGGEERAAAPQLPSAVAQQLAAHSDAVAERLEDGDSCGARAEAEALQADAIAAVNERRIPRRFQEELLSSVAALVESVECVPPVAEEEPEPEDDEEDEEDEDEEDRGKGKGKGKKNGKDKD